MTNNVPHALPQDATKYICPPSRNLPSQWHEAVGWYGGTVRAARSAGRAHFTPELKTCRTERGWSANS